MRILFDQGTPDPLRRHPNEHLVSTAYEKGWSELSNGDLLAAADKAGYDVFVTTDQNLQHQQNLNKYEIAIAVLLSTSWPKISKSVDKILSSINSLPPRGYTEIPV